MERCGACNVVERGTLWSVERCGAWNGMERGTLWSVERCVVPVMLYMGDFTSRNSQVTLKFCQTLAAVEPSKGL